MPAFKKSANKSWESICLDATGSLEAEPRSRPAPPRSARGVGQFEFAEHLLDDRRSRCRNLHPAVDADAQTENARERGQVRVKGAEDPKEKDDLGNEVSQQERVAFLKSWVAKGMVLIERLYGRIQEPEEN